MTYREPQLRPMSEKELEESVRFMNTPVCSTRREDIVRAYMFGSTRILIDGTERATAPEERKRAFRAIEQALENMIPDSEVRVFDAGQDIL